jgi:hypothetical protein
MQKWLKDKKNPFDGKMKKTELYEIINLKKPGVMVLNPFIIKSFTSLVLKVLFSRPT